MPYLTKIRAFFRDRPSLDGPALRREFEMPDDVTEAEFADVVKIFGERYGIQVGVLRPSDPMRVFLVPPRASNPVAWIAERKEFFANVEELEDHLAMQREKRSLEAPTREPETVREYLLCCMGFELVSPATGEYRRP